MAGERRVVLGDRVASDRLPDWTSGGVVIVEWLQRRGLWREVAERIQVQREGGYAGIDALLFLIFFFTAGLVGGLKEFSERAREYCAQLAAVGHRRRLPTQSSMSRLLGAVEPKCLQEAGPWLLQAPGVAAVLQHPSVLSRDAEGVGWHIFDWDPTVETLRHRALPVLEGTPEARRRSESLSKPGYPGRKRGNTQFSRATLQHAGSGLWLGIEMGPGNGALREAFQSAIRQVVATCEGAGLPFDRAMLRADGVGGNVPFITACTEAGLHYITRLAHYQLLEDPQIVEHLNQADWFEVPSSGAGPARQAADLGRVTLEASANTRRADGSAFPPIEVRVVVSRFRSAEDGRGAGVVLNGWQYELFATSLSPGAWPEAEIVAGYFGRSGQENRFSQEDRELGLGRILSYHLPGQQLASLIGLFVWNFQICRGMDLARPPVDLPAQRVESRAPIRAQMPRLTVASEEPPPEEPNDDAAAPEAATAQVVPDHTSADEARSASMSLAATRQTVIGDTRVGSATEGPPPEGPGDDAAAPEATTAQIATDHTPADESGTASTSLAASRQAVIGASDTRVGNATEGPPPGGPGDDATTPEATTAQIATDHSPADESGAASTSLAATRHDVIEALDTADWKAALLKHDGWDWAAHKGGVLCPAKAALPLVRVGDVKGQAVHAQFLAHPGTCNSCSLRQNCLRSDDPHYRKDLRLLVPSSQAETIRELWLRIPYAQRGSHQRPERDPELKPKRPSRSQNPRPRPVWRLKQLAWQPLSPPFDPPRFAVEPPTLLPAALRRLTRAATQPVEIHVRIEVPAPRPRPNPALATGPAERQRRRLTWHDRLRWNELPDKADVEIKLLGGKLIRDLLDPAATVAKSAQVQ